MMLPYSYVPRLVVLPGSGATGKYASENRGECKYSASHTPLCKQYGDRLSHVPCVSKSMSETRCLCSCMHLVLSAAIGK